MPPWLVSNGQNSDAVVHLKNPIAPVAWQQVPFHGPLPSAVARNPIDLDAVVANLTREAGNKGYQPLWVRSDQVQQGHEKLPDGIFGGLGLQPLKAAMPWAGRTSEWPWMQSYDGNQTQPSLSTLHA